MGAAAAAELDSLSSERAGGLPGDGMRTLWQVTNGSFALPTPDRRALATALHQLLDRWRAAEREVVDVEVVDRYRSEYQQIFDVIRGLALLDNEDDAEPFESLD